MTSAGEDFVLIGFSFASFPIVTLLNRVMPVEIMLSMSSWIYDIPVFDRSLAVSLVTIDSFKFSSTLYTS